MKRKWTTNRAGAFPGAAALLAYATIVAAVGCGGKPHDPITLTTDNFAEKYNRAAAHPDSKADEIMASLPVRKGDVIADLGAGGGYFTLMLARKTGPDGRVYAVDISRDHLAYIRQLATDADLANIGLIEAETDDSRIPPVSVDLVFARNIFHLIDNRVDYFTKLAGVLKPGGKIAIIDHNEKSAMHFLSGHYSREDDIRATMEAAGYAAGKRFTFMETFTFIIFTRLAPGNKPAGDIILD